MEIKPAQIDRFAANPPAGLVAALVFGPDHGAVHERANTLARSVVTDLSDPFCVSELEEDKIASDPAMLRDEATAISMTGGRRVLRIRNAGNGLTPVIGSFLADPAGDALIVVEAGDLSKSASLRQLFSRAENAAAIACYPDDVRSLEGLIRSTMSVHGLSIDPDALPVLASRLGSDRGVTRAELEKLSLYAMGEKTITEGHIDAIMGDESALRLDIIADAAGLGDYARLDRTLTRTFAAGTTPAAVLRRAMAHFQQVLATREEVARGANPEFAVKKSRPPIHFTRSRDFLGQVHRWNSEKLLQALNHLYEGEALTRTTGVPGESACSRALFLVAALAQSGSR